MATKETGPEPVKTPAETTAEPTVYVVVEPFINDEDGEPVLWEKGKMVPATHPNVKLMRERFRPFEMPVTRGRGISAPEMRS